MVKRYAGLYCNGTEARIKSRAITIRFLKSTDDSMLDTLQKMSGTRHVGYINGRNVTVDKGQAFMQVRNESSVNIQVVEEPVISYNDMAFIAERNSIVFRAGDSPVWNRNEMILPMSWRLFKNTIVHSGHEYSLQTIPTLSSALDFDIRKNQPDFQKMLQKRMDQANEAEMAWQAYQSAYQYSDFQMSQLDQDVLSDEIMQVINDTIRKKNEAMREAQAEQDYDQPDPPGLDKELLEENEEQLQVNQEMQAEQDAAEVKCYAGGTLSKEDLVSGTGINHQLDKDIIASYLEVKGDFLQDRMHFQFSAGDLCAHDGTVYIRQLSNSKDMMGLNEAAKDPKSKVYAEGEINYDEVNKIGSYEVTDDFYRFLVSCPKWTFAKGRFDAQMAQRIRNA